MAEREEILRNGKMEPKFQVELSELTRRYQRLRERGDDGEAALQG